jgi:hypothetical protein
VDAMIVSRIMPKNKTFGALKLSTKCKQTKKNTPNVSKLSRIVKNNSNLSFPQKQPNSDTMLEIKKWINEKIKMMKTLILPWALHPTVGSHMLFQTCDPPLNFGLI